MNVSVMKYGMFFVGCVSLLAGGYLLGVGDDLGKCITFIVGGIAWTACAPTME